MPYSVLIFDDEPLIVEGLTKRIDWTAMNCQVAGAALNGIEGRRLMETVQPDLIISDIMMSGMTGMELAELNYHHKYARKFIILTAYSDFAFAQQALRFQVEDYILKPIDFAELKKTVLHAISEIEKEKKMMQKTEMLEEGIKSTKEFVTASLLFQIARYSTEAFQENSALVQELTLFCRGVFLEIQIYNLKKGEYSACMGRVQAEILRRFQERNIQILRGSADDKLIFLCQVEDRIDASTARNRIVCVADRVVKDIGEKEGIICVCAVSGVYRTKEELNNQYQESLNLMKNGFFSRNSGILKEESKAEQTGHVEWEILFHHLRHGNLEDMKKEYQKLCGILEQGMDAGYAVYVLKELRYLAMQEASSCGMAQKPSVAMPYDSMNFYEQCRWVYGYLEAVCRYSVIGRSLVEKMMILTKEHYGECQFGLASVAEYLGVNSSYLSRLFKKERNENFVDYLLEIRIQKARFLLETTRLKNGEIAAQIGFEDERYFGKVFKKKCGVTPKQYRESKAKYNFSL